MVTQPHHGDTVSTYYNHHSDAIFLHMYVTKLSVVEKAMESMRIHPGEDLGFAERRG